MSEFDISNHFLPLSRHQYSLWRFSAKFSSSGFFPDIPRC